MPRTEHLTTERHARTTEPADAPPPPRLVCVSAKAHLGLERTERWIDSIRRDVEPELRHLLSMLVPFPLLGSTATKLGASCGAQNLWPESGAYTGEVPASMLAEAGCRYCMVGHSERRALFGEDDHSTARRASAATAAGIVPIACIGEDERTTPSSAAARSREQAAAVLRAVPSEAPVAFLYEPRWAIGADSGADPAHVGTVLHELRRLSADRSGATRLLYGGAVFPGTFRAMRDEAPLDGLGVGRSGRDTAVLREILREVAGCS
ncbi:triosephosphate isomerase [Actinopolyspora erythraea]|uniref:Triosephosphate isomerase n=1 Tax=Actinopolyspora erythraea TaxID=414996 RepID=A0A223RPV2_9ACTN|nr:triose-phosphate isomerase family protein [Actinopolyspora erythraea]ASU77868.1 triosephosphate isomerase [Actinopolyspora erythraea]